MVALMAMPPDLGDLAEGSFHLSVMPVVLTLGFGFGLSVLFSRMAEVREVLRETNKYLLGFLVLATISTLWSVDPGATLHRLYRLFSEILICLAFVVTGWYRIRFQKAVRIALTVLVVSSILYFFIDPVGAIQPSKFGDIIAPELVDAWRGVTLHKNTMGAVSAAAAILWMHAYLTRQAGLAAVLFGVITSVICLVGSRSSTSAFSALLSIAILYVIARPPSPRWSRMTRGISLGLMGVILVYSLGVLKVIPGLSALIEPFVAMTGKDMSFSGRTIIWAIMTSEIAKHPILGIGYAAFWTSPDPSSPSYEFITNMYVWPSEAHNGYLDVINEIGFVGGAGLIGYLFLFLRQCLTLVEIDRSQAALYIALLFSELIFNLSEAHWWNLANVYFFIMTLVTFNIAKSIALAKRASFHTGRMPASGRPPGTELFPQTLGPVPPRRGPRQRSRAFT